VAVVFVKRLRPFVTENTPSLCADFDPASGVRSVGIGDELSAGLFSLPFGERVV
jgi:hypothetical protein